MSHILCVWGAFIVNPVHAKDSYHYRNNGVVEFFVFVLSTR